MDPIMIMLISAVVVGLVFFFGYAVGVHRFRVRFDEHETDEDAFEGLLKDVGRARRSILIVAHSHNHFHFEAEEGGMVGKLTALLRQKSRENVSIEIILGSSPPMFLARLARDRVITLSMIDPDRLGWTGRIIDERTVEVHSALQEGLAPADCFRRAERMHLPMVEYLRGAKTTGVPRHFVDIVA